MVKHTPPDRGGKTDGTQVAAAPSAQPIPSLFPPGTALTAATGAVGALIFSWLGVPAALLLGPMTATLILALSGVPLAYPRWLQAGVLGLIGISVGGSLTPDLLGQAALWLPSVGGQVAAHLLALAVGCLTMRYMARQSFETAFLASYPGHLIMVLSAAAGGKADSRIVAIAQSFRLVVLVAAVPLVVGSVESARPAPALDDLNPLDVLTVVGAGLFGIAAARMIRMPSPPLMGGILGAGAAAMLGFSLGPIPDMTGDGLLAVVGTMIGARFAGMSRRMLLASIPQCAVTVFAVLFTVAAVAWVMSLLLGLPFGQVLLAYSPGGADVMPLLALAQGHDAVYVGVHHGVRLLTMAVLLPIAMRMFSARI